MSDLPSVAPPGAEEGAPRSIFLVGMMGAGKSTIARLLAAAANFEFIDADGEVARRAGASISTIFELEGEAAFRARESQLLGELCLRPRIVLATGGGAILTAHNRELLRQNGLVVFLEASADEIARRTRKDTGRPLLSGATGDERRARIEALLAHREPLYREVAQLVFRSAANSPKRLVEAIFAHPRVAAMLAHAAVEGGRQP
ncbi:MAG TPA: shikimate kinase [Burkholderiaceae bacterium]